MGWIFDSFTWGFIAQRFIKLRANFVSSGLETSSGSYP
jgi:hypothetical protein